MATPINREYTVEQIRDLVPGVPTFSGTATWTAEFPESLWEELADLGSENWRQFEEQFQRIWNFLIGYSFQPPRWAFLQLWSYRERVKYSGEPDWPPLEVDFPPEAELLPPVSDYCRAFHLGPCRLRIGGFGTWTTDSREKPIRWNFERERP